MYAQDQRGKWPVAVHEPKAHLPIGTERRWYDLVGQYVSSVQMETATDLAKARDSVLWGCPEWQGNEYDPTDVAGKLRPGYGMNYYPSFFEDGGKVADLAYITNTWGRYPNMNRYRNPTQRALLADSITHVITTPDTFSSAGKWFPYDPIATGAFYVDASRHARRGLKKQQSYATPCLNMVFCDGHAATVSVREAWNAIHNPGQDKAGN